MTTAFQYIFDNAESISINKKAVVSQTISRDQTVRAVSRGGKIWRFDVSLPDGIPWTQARQYIEAIDNADRYTVGTVALNNPGYSNWLSDYQGNSANLTGFHGTWVQGSTTLTLNFSPATASGFKFRKGDFIQLGSTGKVYSVAQDVAFNSNTVTLNRAVIDASSSGSLRVGPNVTWSVICTQLPQWNIFSRDQVSWSGAFTFYESMV
jgi:hypothetical protein